MNFILLLAPKEKGTCPKDLDDATVRRLADALARADAQSVNITLPVNAEVLPSYNSHLIKVTGFGSSDAHINFSFASSF